MDPKNFIIDSITSFWISRISFVSSLRKIVFCWSFAWNSIYLSWLISESAVWKVPFRVCAEMSAKPGHNPRKKHNFCTLNFQLFLTNSFWKWTFLGNVFMSAWKNAIEASASQKLVRHVLDWNRHVSQLLAIIASTSPIWWSFSSPLTATLRELSPNSALFASAVLAGKNLITSR